MTAAAMSSSLMLPATVMLVTGACNTLLMKFLTRQVAAPGPGMAPTNFDYPFFQTMLMMLGELMCLGVFLLKPKDLAKQTVPPWIMVIPVSCDWAATTFVNAAYVMIPASTIQMCRGCIVLFTCFLSVTVLGRRQEPYHYAGVALVAIGISIVSLEAVLFSGPEKSVDSPRWMGLMFCIVGQLFQSSMIVVEEKFLKTYTVPPLQMVGLEGFFGTLIGCVLLIGLQATGLEKASEAFYMLEVDSKVQIGVVASMFSIAFFNWSGVTVTQRASAVARSTIDVSRPAIIWVV